MRYNEANGESDQYRLTLSALLIAGLVCFAVLFAVISAIHSYLIVLYSEKDKAAQTVGAYYASNALGRLVGTILSGVIFQFTEARFGLSMCLWVATAFLILSALSAMKLRPHHVPNSGTLNLDDLTCKQKKKQ